MSELFVFFTSPGSPNLNQIQFDGSAWSDIEEVTTDDKPPQVPTTDVTPAAVLTPDNQLMLIYTTPAISGQLIIAIEFDGSKWKTNGAVAGLFGAPDTQTSPAAALCNKEIWVVYQGQGANDLCVAINDPVGGWQQEGQTVYQLSGGLIAPQSDVSPSAIFYQDKLYVIYKNVNSTDLYFFTYDFTTEQFGGAVSIKSQAGPIEPESNYAPSLAVFNGLLYMIYKSPDNDNLNYAYYDGNQDIWAGNSLISGQPGHIRPESATNPGVAVYNGLLYLIYKGPNQNDLNTSVFDGTTWSENTQIFKQGGGRHPQASVNPCAIAYPA